MIALESGDIIHLMRDVMPYVAWFTRTEVTTGLDLGPADVSMEARGEDSTQAAASAGMTMNFRFMAKMYAFESLLRNCALFLLQMQTRFLPFPFAL